MHSDNQNVQSWKAFYLLRCHCSGCFYPVFSITYPHLRIAEWKFQLNSMTIRTWFGFYRFIWLCLRQGGLKSAHTNDVGRSVSGNGDINIQLATSIYFLFSSHKLWSCVSARRSLHTIRLAIVHHTQYRNRCHHRHIRCDASVIGSVVLIGGLRRRVPNAQNAKNFWCT